MFWALSAPTMPSSCGPAVRICPLRALARSLLTWRDDNSRRSFLRCTAIGSIGARFIGAAAGFALAAPRLVVRASLSVAAGAGDHPVHARRRARRAAAAGGAEAVGEMGAGRRGREPRRRQHADRHGRGDQEPDRRLHAADDRRPDLHPQSAALRHAAVFDEGARSDHPDGVDPAHAGGVAQGAGRRT